MHTLVERCSHQILSPEVHALFKEQWKRCSNCAYDPENNKRCPNYSPTGGYYVCDKNSDIASSTPQDLDGIRA